MINLNATKKNISFLESENKNLKSQLDFIEEQNKYIDKLEKMIKEKDNIINEIKDNWNDLTEDKVYLKMPKETLVKIINIKRDTIAYIRIKRDKLQSRLDKAIEYMEEKEEKQIAYNFDYWLDKYQIKELLDILKGSDKE